MTSTTYDRLDEELRAADATALSALLALRNAEINGIDVGSPVWHERLGKARDAADRVLAAARAMSSEMRTQRLRNDVHGSSSQAGLASLRAGARLTRPACSQADVGLPCGHYDPCVECTPDGVIA